jgi:hypothetical protein
MARPIITESQSNRDNLLQILLYKEYKEYLKEFQETKRLHYLIMTTEFEKKLLTFDEWLEKILEEF